MRNQAYSLRYFYVTVGDMVHQWTSHGERAPPYTTKLKLRLLESVDASTYYYFQATTALYKTTTV